MTTIVRRTFLRGSGLALAAALPGSLLGRAARAAAGGTLTIGVPESFSTLDPYKKIGRLDYNAVINIFDTLVAYGPDFVITPALATDWREVDATTWEFDLREGVTFHDGTPFDAEAAKASMDLVLEGSFGSQFELIESVEATGPMTLTIRTGAPFPTLLAQLTQQYASMMPAGAYDDDFGADPIGTGPFAFESLEPSRDLVLTKNPDWWGEADGTPLPLVGTVMPDKEMAALALQAGEIDVLYELPAALAPVLGADPSVVVSSAPTLGWEFIMFNVAEPPFDSVHARPAVQHAIDRSALVGAASFGTATPALGPIAPGSWAYDAAAAEAGAISATADRDAARAELAAGGLEDGFSFPMIYPTFPEFSTMAQAVQAQLAEVGITVELVGKDIGATLDDLFAGNFTALMINWSGRIDEALTFPSFFKTGGGNNFGEFSDAEIDAIIDAAGAAPTLEERKALYLEAQEMVIDASPLAWLTVPSELRATRGDVTGLSNYGDLRLRAWTVARE